MMQRMGCMLLVEKLPINVWGEASYAVVRVINLSPSVPFDGDVHNRVWFGKDVSCDHCIVFGCKTYVHFP